VKERSRLKDLGVDERIMNLKFKIIGWISVFGHLTVYVKSCKYLTEVEDACVFLK
jgi:hypothetical protein